MTSEQIQSLKVGDTVRFTYSNNRKVVGGRVDRVMVSGVRIEWDEGWFGSYDYNRLNDQFEKVEVV